MFPCEPPRAEVETMDLGRETENTAITNTPCDHKKLKEIVMRRQGT